MKLIHTILLLAVATIAYAQEESRVATKADSLLHGLDKTKIQPLSVSNTLKTPLSDVAVAKSEVQDKYDSIASLLSKPQEEMARNKSKIDSIQNRIAKKIDSLSALPNPNKLLIKSLDSLHSQLDSLKQTGLGKNVTEAAEKVKQVQSKVSEKVTAIENTINEKLGLPTVSVPGGGNGLDKININPNFTENTLGSSLDLNKELPGLEVNELGEIKEAANIPKEKLANIEGVKEVQGKMGEASEITGQVNGYSGDVKNLAKGNIESTEQLPAALETKAASLEEVKAFQKEIAPVTDYSEMIKKWNSDPEVAKELALNKAKEQAVNHFAGHEQELKAAMDQLLKVKVKYKDRETVIDLFKKPENPMKGKSFTERLVPGLLFHVYRSGDWFIDFNPYAGYRFSGKLNGGIGWNYRLAYSKGQREIYPAKVYGPRIYAEYDLFKGFHPRIEFEVLNTYLPSYLASSDLGTRQWVRTMFVGLNKKYKISGQIKGTASVMYNLFDVHRKAPYGDKVVVRFGLEMVMKKKVKKSP